MRGVAAFLFLFKSICVNGYSVFFLLQIMRAGKTESTIQPHASLTKTFGHSSSVTPLQQGYLAENSESTKDDGTEDADASTKVDAKSEKLCFLIKFHLQFNLTFQTIDDKAKNVPYNITEKDGTNVTRSCADGQSLTMSWGNNTSSITFKFKQNVADTTYMLSNIDISIDVNEKYPEAKAKQIVRLTYTSKDDFKTPIGKSTSRGQPKTLQFKSSVNEKVDVILSNVQLEAYRTSSDESFSTSLESSTNVDNGSTIVIAIVCPLLLILALALIIGFVWRRRQGRECCFTPTGSRD